MQSKFRQFVLSVDKKFHLYPARRGNRVLRNFPATSPASRTQTEVGPERQIFRRTGCRRRSKLDRELFSKLPSIPAKLKRRRNFFPAPVPTRRWRLRPWKSASPTLLGFPRTAAQGTRSSPWRHRSGRWSRRHAEIYRTCTVCDKPCCRVWSETMEQHIFMWHKHKIIAGSTEKHRTNVLNTQIM